MGSPEAVVKDVAGSGGCRRRPRARGTGGRSRRVREGPAATGRRGVPGAGVERLRLGAGGSDTIVPLFLEKEHYLIQPPQ